MQMTVIVILLICCILFIVYGYCSNFILERNVVRFLNNNGETNQKELRFILLADLHGAVFGKGNKKLLTAVKSICPDGVLIAGDMVVKNGKGSSVTLTLCKELLKICPVFYALGNHEIRLENRQSFLEELVGNGVILLDNQSVIHTFQGKKVRIAGLTLEEEYYGKVWQENELTLEAMENMLPSGKEENIATILIAHNPQYFPIYAKWGADLVVSGHVHGGIMTLPFGGVIAPSLRIFPKYTNGVYEEGTSRLVLSRGLGLHHIKLRFFNFPEMITIYWDGDKNMVC